jgi:hypothetical protein
VADEDQPAQPDEPGLLSPHLHELLAELDAWLVGQPRDSLVEHVLPFATEWVLREIDGLDVDRYTEEAKVFILATPMPDRVLLRFKKDAVYWVGQRLLVDERHEPQPELARAILDSARALIGERAGLLEKAGYANVAAGFRAVLAESAGGEPPADLIWSALALRIAEPFLVDPVNVLPVTPSPSEPPEPSRE